MNGDAQVSTEMKKRKRSRSRSPSPNNARHQVRQFARSEVQRMIQNEVFHAVEQIEAKIEDVLGKVKQLECDTKYELGIRQLEAQIKKLNRRGDAAWACIQKYGICETQDDTEKQVQQTIPAISVKVLDIQRQESEEETKITLSNNTIKTDLHEDWSHVKKEPSSPLPVSSAASSGSPQHQMLDETLKKELTFPGHSTDDITKLVIDGLKEEPCEDNSPAESTESEMGTIFPPLPIAPFPSTLDAEAAHFNIPQKPTLQLAVIKKPPGLSVLWNMEEDDPSAPPLDSFSIFMTIETVKDNSVFTEWKTLGDFKACPLPMCVMLSKYKPGYHVGFTVVAKDKFGRYGPFSNVVAAKIPESI